MFMKIVQLSNGMVVNLDAYAAFTMITHEDEYAEAIYPYSGGFITLSEDAGLMLKRELVNSSNAKWVYIQDNDIECIINLPFITQIEYNDSDLYTVWFGSSFKFQYNGDEDDLSFDESECSICPPWNEIKPASFQLIKLELNPVEIYCECGRGSRRDTRW